MAEFRVDEGTTLVRWAAYQGRRGDQPAAAARTGDERRPWLFVENEVLVNARDRETLGMLERFGGVMLNPQPLPPRPDLPNRRARRLSEADLADAPQTVTVRFDESPRDDRADRPTSEVPDVVTFSSELGAQVTALVDSLRAEGRRAGLNVVGEPFAMPLQSPSEGAGLVYGSDPTQWPAFGGRSRVADAWQLVESVRQVRGGTAVWVAISDQGFWVDGSGTPLLGTGQTASDFGPGVLQWNLEAEGSPLPSSMTSFHGNQVASAAVAAVGDGNGAAGSGGTIALPALFHSARTAERALRAARVAVWWGLDVLNFSWGFWGQSEFWFDTDTWDDTFNWAADNDVVVIAAAGNDNLDLPDDRNIRPATRTPRTLTIGSLLQDDTKRPSSNHGSSVNLWAPGTQIEVAPDGGALQGSRVDGTSFAAPIVAGVAAMMRYVNPAISADDVRRILVETGWQGAGAVTRGLDAFAAVWTALQRSLPDTGEANNSPASAAPLQQGAPAGTLSLPGANGISALSSGADRDYWSFSVERLNSVTITAEWYHRIANLSIAVEPVGEVQGTVDLSAGAGTGSRTLTGLLPPGRYTVRVTGSSATAYRLRVRLTDPDLPPDAFEPNDSFDAATRLEFESTMGGAGGGIGGVAIGWRRHLGAWGPGTFPLTLHRWASLLGWTFVNDDYFEFDVPRRTVFHIPLIEISDADEPLAVTLHDDARSVIASWSGHAMRIEPPAQTHCYLKVSAARQTRYTLRVGLTIDRDALPGPLQEELHVGPKWWGDPPPFSLVETVTHWAVDVGREELEDRELAYSVEYPAEVGVGDGGGPAGNERVELDLLTLAGEQIRGAELVDGVHVVDVTGLDHGTYVVRASRASAPVDGADVRPLVRVVPPMRTFGRQ